MRQLRSRGMDRDRGRGQVLLVLRAMRHRWREDDRDRGSETIEAVIGVPAFLLFIAMIIAGGRVAIAHEAMQSIAADAARSASIARTQAEASSAASASAQTTLTQQGLQCVSERITVDTSGFAVPVGTPATVSATVTCVVNLSDVSFPGLPGHLSLTATMTSPLDTYRER
jgi:Flp pilus assembly protein TadG